MGDDCVSDEATSNELAIAPTFTTQLITQEVLIGQAVTMSCDVIGTPTPEITWYQVRNTMLTDWY